MRKSVRCECFPFYSLINERVSLCHSCISEKVSSIKTFSIYSLTNKKVLLMRNVVHLMVSLMIMSHS